jgi:hypothetical protein
LTGKRDGEYNPNHLDILAWRCFLESQYEVLNPWAEADPRPLSGISVRVNELSGKRIGLFINYKRAAPLILNAVQKKLALRFPTASFSEFLFRQNFDISQTPEMKSLVDWLKGVDTVIAAVGD